MNVALQRITYEELRNQIRIAADDRYAIISGYLTKSVRNTLLENPNLTMIRKQP